MILGEVGANPNETVNISLTQVGGSSADLIGAAITITDDDSGDTLFTATWNGNTITTEIDVNTNYTVSVASITGYLTCLDRSYQAGYQTTRNIGFQYRALGAFVEATDGTLYTSSSWSGSGKTANAVVVLTSSCKVRIALTGAVIKAHSNNTDPLENYTTQISTETDAKVDYNGKDNTEKIVAFNKAYDTNTTSYAAPYCKSYTFIYPANQKGYLPSLGQLWTMYQNKAAIDACISACGGEAMVTTGYTYSSTYGGKEHGSSESLWGLLWSKGVLSQWRALIDVAPVRPVCDYE